MYVIALMICISMLLKNFMFLRNKHTHIHTRERERGFNIKAYYKFHLKVTVTFEGGWGKLYAQ